MNLKETRDRLALLAEIVRGSRKLLIFTHPQPDPDTLAPAFASKKLIAGEPCEGEG